MIPFGNLKKHYSLIKSNIDKAISDVLQGGWFILGETLKSFEKEFAEYCGKKYGVGVGNGTDALLLALKAYGIKQGDEVISVPNTAIPTISAIVSSGAKPVFVDVGEDYLIDVNKIEAAITEKTKAIMPVHLYGQVCDMEPILKIAEKYNLHVIEDCAQSHGAEYKEKKSPIGETGCFSFYPSKNLGAFGDAGMIVTDNEDLAKKLRMLRDYGKSERNSAKLHGYNSRLDDIQAAILSVKLKYLDMWNNERRKIAFIYDILLKNNFKIPIENKNNKHVYHLYVIKTDKRDELQNFLKNKGIGSVIHYPIPIHLQPAYEYLGYKEGDFPKAEQYASEILSLPIFPELENEEIQEVVKVIKEFFEN